MVHTEFHKKKQRQRKEKRAAKKEEKKVEAFTPAPTQTLKPTETQDPSQILDPSQRLTPTFEKGTSTSERRTQRESLFRKTTDEPGKLTPSQKEARRKEIMKTGELKDAAVQTFPRAGQDPLKVPEETAGKDVDFLEGVDVKTLEQPGSKESKPENIRVTSQGDKFDITKQLTQRDFSSPDSFKQALKAARTGGGLLASGKIATEENLRRAQPSEFAQSFLPEEEPLPTEAPLPEAPGEEPSLLKQIGQAAKAQAEEVTIAPGIKGRVPLGAKAAVAGGAFFGGVGAAAGAGARAAAAAPKVIRAQKAISAGRAANAGDKIAKSNIQKGMGKWIKKNIATTLAVSGLSVGALIAAPLIRINTMKKNSTTQIENIGTMETMVLEGKLSPQQLKAMIDPIVDQMDGYERDIQLIMQKSIKQRFNPQASGDAIEEINKVRVRIFDAQTSAIAVSTQGVGDIDWEENALFLAENNIDLVPDILVPPEERGEVPFRPFSPSEEFELERVESPGR